MFIGAIFALGGGLVTLYTLVKIFSGERLTIIAWLTNFAYVMWLVATILGILTLLLGQVIFLPAFVVPMIALLVHLYPKYNPSVKSVVHAEDFPITFTLLTHNILCSMRDYSSLGAQIRQIDADIVTLQEVIPMAETLLARELADIYPYMAFHAVEGYRGQAVLSKFPILEDEYWQWYMGYQRSVIDIRGKRITLFNAHPPQNIMPGSDYSGKLRTGDIVQLLEKASQQPDPVVIAGDFNMIDVTADYGRVTGVYHDVYAEVRRGMGRTFPVGRRYFPLMARIDYVFRSEAFAPLEAQVIPTSAGSDHLPLLVKLGIYDTQPQADRVDN